MIRDVLSRVLGSICWPLKLTLSQANSKAVAETGLTAATTESSDGNLASLPQISIAAYHEAGHCVAAFSSKFHGLSPYSVSLGSYGSGAAHIALRKSKLRTAGKVATAEIPRDPEVAQDFALVLAAGLVAERIAEERNTKLCANPSCAFPDHEVARETLHAANFPFDLAKLEKAAELVLKREWATVSLLAELLQQRGSLDGHEIESFLETHIVTSKA